MLNIQKVRKARQGLQIPGGLMDIVGVQKKQEEPIVPKINQIAIEGYQPNPYMNSNPNPIIKNIGNGLNQGLDILGNFITPNEGYYGKYGSWQQTGDQLYNNVSNTLGSINPILGLSMKGLGLINKISPSTDSMTKQDAILNSIPILNSINTGFGKKTQDFSINQEAVNQVGSGYQGTVNDLNKANQLKNKKYGLFSNKARKKADQQITDAKEQQYRMTSIANENYDLQSMSTDLNSMNYYTNINGGIDPRYLRAKQGGVLKRVKNLRFHKQGGQFEPIIEEEWEPIISDPIEEFKEGGKTEESDIPEIEETSQKNVIPEGALHKNKHHIENTEGLTQKGIPVIDNEGSQQAEIEKEEIIFTLEVTKKLEELCKEGTDEAAIQAGKLLVQEILFNTEDNVGLINSLKNGGVINETK